MEGFESRIKSLIKEAQGYLKKADEVKLDDTKSNFILGVYGELDQIREGIVDGYIGNICHEDEKRLKDSLWSISTWFLPKDQLVSVDEVRQFRGVIYDARQDMEDLCDSEGEAIEETIAYDDAIRELDRIVTCINVYKAEYTATMFNEFKAKVKHLLPAN